MPSNPDAITPTRCAEFAEQLETAIARLRGYGVSLADDSRLPSAAAELRRTALAGAFPEDGAARRSLLSALRDATEWSAISEALRPPIEGEFLGDLCRAVRGSLVPPPGEILEPLQLQAQLFFGALLVQDGRPLGAPTKRGQPDFIIHDGLLAHGIEVKAPESEAGLRRAVRKADRQLTRLSGGGMAVLDISLLVQPALGGWESPDGTDVWLQERLRQIVSPLKVTLREEVERRGSWERGRGITASCLIARVQHWLGEVPGSAMWVAWRRYYRTHGTLAFWRATMLGDRVEGALRQVKPDLEIAWEK